MVVLLAAAALMPQRVEAQSSMKIKGKSFVVSPAADMTWAPMVGGPPGVSEARLWGDSTKGAYGAFSKFPAGWSAPLHTHPNDHKVAIISGTWIHGEPGKPDARLGPGSYLFQPAGRKHTSACDAASECVVFIESPGKFGITMVEEMKKPAK
ncbi:MAG: cupin domain-containing protein [Acidobacteriota bacterium]